MKKTANSHKLPLDLRAELLNGVLKPVVRINERGSGVLVHSEAGLTLVITNAHVVEDDVKDEKKLDETPFIFVDRYSYDNRGKLKGFFRCQSEIVAYDRSNDLAMLRLRDPDIEDSIAQLPTDDFITNLCLFDEVYVVGCSLGGFPVPSKGILSALNGEYENREYWMSSAPVVFGNSGGGAFALDPTTNKFRLMGIPTAIMFLQSDDEHKPQGDLLPHINYIVPAYRVRSFIEYVLEELQPIKKDLEEER